MTYIFIKHRRDRKYEVRFNAEQTRDYRLILLSLKTHFDPTARVYDPRTRTWLIEDKSGNDVDRWRAKMVEELCPLMEFVCERQKVWEEAIEESYRTLHVLPSAPWEIVQSAYNILADLCTAPGGDRSRLAQIETAYERLRKELKEDESSERGS